jgi:SH3-like domain-containing protein
MIRLAFLLLFLSLPAFAQESLDNLPLPRWVSLASDEVNLRTGPGKRYPIDWVVKKKTLPVEITQEFEHWRKIKLPDGDGGWVHKSMLSGVRRTMINKGEETLSVKPFSDAAARARIQKNVIAALQSCREKWCEIEVGGFSGWVPKKSLWGVYRDEIFD